MTAGHGLWFVLPVHRGKGLTFQFQSFSCGYAVAVAENQAKGVLFGIIASISVVEVS